MLSHIKAEYYGNEIPEINLSFSSGVTLILGEVGAGKTNVLKIIGGIKEIIDGEIILDGQRIEEIEPKNRNMAYVGKDSVPFGNVYGALLQPLRLRKVNKKVAAFLAKEAADKFGLDTKIKIKDLNKEQLLKFFAARLSLRNPVVTMFDEPYHFFGEENSAFITRLIKEKKGVVIVTSCDGGDIERLKPDELIILRRGELLKHGKTDEVLADKSDEYINRFTH